jgi:hypothetical protein
LIFTGGSLAGRSISQDYRVAKLAKDLGLSARGDHLGHLTAHAVSKVRQIVDEWPERVESLETLLRIVASRLSVCVEYIRTNADVERIARERAAYSPTLAATLRCEFLKGTSEGNLIEHQDPRPGDRRYLAVIDARGDRAIRAYFTAWHEISHVLTTPPQLEFKLFRRTPSAEEVRKDPVESAVDHIAGTIAFYEPIFAPALSAEIARFGGITIEAIQRARDTVAPSASLYAAIVSAVRLHSEPLCFVRAEKRLKPVEQRKLGSTQEELALGLRPEQVVPKLRLVDVVLNDGARNCQLRLHAHLRVPTKSLISLIHQDLIITERDALEDQAWWETTADGPLPSMSFRVTAVRKGESVYGLIQPVS